MRAMRQVMGQLVLDCVSSRSTRARRARAKFALSAAALAGLSGMASGQIKTWTGGSSQDSNWTSQANWFGSIAPVPGSDGLVFDGISRLVNNNDFAPNSVFNGITFNSTAGAFTISGNALTLHGDITDNTTIVTQTLNTPLILDATRNFTVADNAFLALTGLISGSSFGLNKLGNGLLTLTSSNSFGGPLTISAGTLSVDGDGELGTIPASATPGNIMMTGGTLRFTPVGAATSGAGTIASTRGISVGTNSGLGIGTFDVFTSVTWTYGGSITNGSLTGTGGITKMSFGTLVLSGSNSYTGPTRIGNGTLALNFSQATAPVNDIINSNSALILGGSNAGLGAVNNSKLLVIGKGSTTNTQSFSSTAIDIGPALIQGSSGASGALTVNLGTLSTTAGGVVNFVLPTSGNINVGSTPLTNGIIGGWATVGTNAIFGSGTANIVQGTDWATRDGSGNVQAYTGYTSFDFTGGNTIRNQVNAATNLQINYGSASITAPVDTTVSGITDVNTIALMFTGGTTGSGIYIGPGNTLRLGQYGGIFRQDTNATATMMIGGVSNTPQSGSGDAGSQNVGTLTAGGPNPQPGDVAQLVFTVNSSSETTGTVIVEPVVADNVVGAVTEPVAFVKTGVGSMKIDGINSYTGGTYLLQGRVQLAGSEIGVGNPTGFGTGPVFIFPGAQAFPSGVGDFATTNEAIPNHFFIAGNGIAAELDGAIRFGNGMRISGDLTLIGDARLGGGNGGATGISGAITGDFDLDLGALTTINSNFTIYNPANDWRGTTTLNARNTGSSNTVHLGASEVIPNGIGRGNLVLNAQTSGGSITLDMAGFNETINGLRSTGTAGNQYILNSASNTLSTLTVGDYDQSGIYAGHINDGTGTVALTKIGTGGQTLSSDSNYSGPTNINNGALSVTGSLNSSGVVNVNTSSTAAGELNGGTVSGTGTVGNVTLAANNGSHKARISPGATGALGDTGTLQMSSLNALGGDLAFDLVSPGTQDFIQVNGAATFNGTSGKATITPGPSGQAGLYTILHANGGISYLNNGTPTLNAPTSSRSVFSINTSLANDITLTITGGSATLTWVGNSGTRWDITNTTNWTSAATTGNPNQFYNGDAVIFNDTANNNVTVPVTVIPGGVTFNNNTSTFTVGGFGAIAGSTTVTLNGTGKVIFTVPNTYSGQTTINGGTLQIGTIAAISNFGSFGSGTVQMANNSNLVFARTDAITVANRITGSGQLSFVDTGTITLTNQNNDYTGATNINAGTVKIGSFNALGQTSGTLNVASGGALDVGGVGTADVGGGLQNKQINIAGTGAGGSGALVNTGASQQEAFQKVTLTANATVGGTGRMDIRNGDASLNLNGNTLTKVGTNVFGVANGNISDGTIIVTGGTFQLEGSTNVAGTGKISVGTLGTLAFNQTTGNITRDIELNGANVTNAAQTSAATFNSNISLIGTTNSTFNITGTGSGAQLVVNGNITTANSSLGIIKAGAGTVTLNGSSNFQGGVTINGGVVQLGNDGALNSANPNAVTFGASPAAGTGLKLSGHSVTISGLNTNAIPGSPVVENDSGTDATLTINATGTNTFAGIFQDTGAKLAVTKTGPGSLVLSGSNTNSGSITITTGTIQLGNGGASGAFQSNQEIVNNANLAINRNDTADNAFNLSNPSSGTGAVHFNGPGTTVMGGNYSYSGNTNVNNGVLIANGSLNTAGNVFVNAVAATSTAGVLAGNGTLGTVTVSNNATVGSTTFTAGVRVGTSTADGSTGNLTMAGLNVNGGNFRLDIGGDNITVNGPAHFIAGASSTTSTLTAVFQNTPGVGTYNILTASGGLTIDSGALPTIDRIFTNNGSFTPNGNGTRLGASLNQSGNILQLVITGGAPKSLLWRGTPGGTTWDINNNVNWLDSADNTTQEKYFDLDTIKFDDSALAANRTITLNSLVKPTQVNVQNSGGDYSITGTGGIIGVTSLTKDGSSKLILGLSNTFSGQTQINQGAVQLASNTALSPNSVVNMGDVTLDLAGFNATVGGLTSGSSNAIVGNSSTTAGSISTLTVAATNENQFAGVIRDNLPSGGTQKVALTVASGTLTLTNASTYTGATVINGGGTLQLGNGGTTGTISASTTVTANGYLMLNRSDGITLPNTVGGTGGIYKNGSGTLTINTFNPTVSYSGTTFINQGTLVLADGGQIGNGTSAISDSSNLLLAKTGNYTFANPVSGGGSVEKIGAGIATFSAANPFTGTATITTGTAVVTNSQSLGNPAGGDVYVKNGAAVDVVGIVTANGGTLGPRTYHVIGSGVGGNGVLLNSGILAQQNVFQHVILDGDATFNAATGGRFDIRGTAGNTSLDLQSHTLTKIGGGTINLVNADVGAGNIVVSAGTLGLEGSTNVPDNGDNTSITYSGANVGGEFFNSTGTITRPMVISGTGVTFGNASATASLVGSNITLLQDLTVTQFAGTGILTFSGVIGDAGTTHGIIKTGATSIAFNGANTYTGATDIRGGTLTIGSSGSINQSSAILLSNGAALDVTAPSGGLTTPTNATIAGTGTIYGTVTHNSGTIGAGATFNAGTLNFNNGLTLGSVNLNADLGAPTVVGGGVNDLIAVNGSLTLNGTTTINAAFLGLPTVGLYPLMTFTSQNGGGSFALGSIGFRGAASLVTTATQLSLNVTAASAVSLSWRGPTGTWDLQNNANWLNAGATDKFFQGDSVLFDDTASVPTTIAITGTLTPFLTTVNSNTNNYSFNGPGGLASGGSLIKSGSSVLTINNTNTFTGGTTINGGTISVGSNIGALTGSITFDGGALAVQNNSTTATVTFGGANTYSVPTGSIGTIALTGSSSNANNVSIALAGTLNNGAAATGGVLNIKFVDQSATAQTVDLAGTFNAYSGKINLLSDGKTIIRLNNGTNSNNIGRTIFDLGTVGTLANGQSSNSTVTLGGLIGGPDTFLKGFSGASGGTTTTYNIGSASVDTTFAGTVQNGTAGTASFAVSLVKAGTATLMLTGTNTFTGSVAVNSGTLGLTASNAYSGATTVNAGGNLVLTGALPNTSTVVVNGGALYLGNGGTGGTFKGSVVVNDAGSIIINHSDDITIPNVIGGIGGITKLANDTVTLTGPLSFTGGLDVQGGTLATTINLPFSSVSIAGGAVVTQTAGVSSNVVAKINVLKSLDTAGSTGKINVNNNATIIDYAPGNSPDASIRSQLVSGYANGAWTGNGVQSGSAAAAASSAHPTAIGYAEASSIGIGPSGGLFLTKGVDNSSILTRYTLSGDSNLDGAVNTLDFNSLAANFNSSGKEWVQGDYNYDGVVNALDFNAIATNFGAALPSDPLGGASLGTLVPEPGSIGLVGIGLLAGLTRRRRR